ncbi:hypothetical protein PRZ48_011309 [Zasmidium cellare]|uniref:Uncharacterized protein n=1 Tax=Zasmidium cellare TaxID=395010 RepID=A0ABR0E677_ZASCE|nr:hypothetical protein PRZ48_011309 [Zasmidium cellare]
MPQTNPSGTIVQALEDDIEDVQKLLLLKAMSQYVPNDQHKAITSQPREKLANDGYKTWRRYLDNLSYLCDFKSGGKTVVSLYAQDAANDTVFWLATNHPGGETKNRMRNHLVFILNELSSTPRSIDDPTQAIMQQSIKLSADKVKHYYNKLVAELESIRAESPSSQTSGDRRIPEIVMDKLQRATGDDELQNHHMLCSAACEIVSSSGYNRIAELSVPPGSRYKKVKHYLIRLCSWYTASRYVTKYWGMFAEELRGATVEIVSLDQFHQTTNVNFPPNVRDALLWILGSQQQPFASALQQKLTPAGALLKTEGGRARGSIIHAEAALAEFVHFHEMEPLYEDRYVGCSKQSCYGCKIYLSKHPGGFEQRPSHGNAWFKWYPPRLREQPDDRETSSLLRRMAMVMQADLKDTLLGSNLGKRQLFESTSGVGTTIRHMQEALRLNKES